MTCFLEAFYDDGFVVSGCADKVKCYSCGVGLYKWHQSCDPWEQHALHMPTCPHLQAKGQHFIQQAAEAQVISLGLLHKLYVLSLISNPRKMLADTH